MPEHVVALDASLPDSGSEQVDDSPVAEGAASGTKMLVLDLCGGLGSEFAVSETVAPAAGTILVADIKPTWFTGTWVSYGEFVSSADPFGLAGSYPDWTGSSGLRLVLFLPSEPTKVAPTKVIDRCVAIAATIPRCQVCLVGPIRVMNGSDELSAFEESMVSRFQNAAANTIVVRTGQVVDPPRGRPAAWNKLAKWYPLVPAIVMSVFLDRDELFSAVDRVTNPLSAGRNRRLVLLGARRSLRDVLAEFVHPCPFTTFVTMLARLLSWLQIGRLGYVLFVAVACVYRPWRRWQFSALNPRSAGELLGLYHPLNQRHVALAGYNTGVVHFGWKYPGRTVVRTTGSGRLVRVGQQTVTVDAGVLLKRVVQELGTRGKELYVVPNYSYVSLGTTFMVPVHGSGSEVSTLGETIEQVLVYDPAADRFLRLRRGDERFGRYLYNPSSGILVLRLRLRVRNKSRYFVKRSQLGSPRAAEIWQRFSDPDAANIELRKSRAADTSVGVSKYYTTSSGDPETLEVPRDSIGRLWDRLEEDAVTSWLFHTYVRKWGFHVELFLDEREFDIFWRSHARLPLSKLQLRLLKRDGLPGSPFGDCDRISVDIFMKRKDSPAFLSFMKEHLPHARFNPGKHSM